MPELPEVETVCTELALSIKGAIIDRAVLLRPNLRIPFPAHFEELLTDQIITDIRRRAKYLLFELSSGSIIISHLGMSGQFSVLAKAPKTFAKHDHVVWYLRDGRVVVYNDTRRFGLMTLSTKTNIFAHPLLAILGPEPFEKAFTATYLQDELLKRRTPIKVSLMDQSLVVGVGNIYASEALFLAKIHPLTPANMAADQAKLLVKCIKKVLGDAIKSGGSSLRDFVHVSGESGYFQHHFNVYGRTEKPCFTCGSPIKILRQSGRSTFFCPQCQPLLPTPVDK
jgi:formamidopyrimidine-DNA glycosylase